jgi:hypothetical protein
MIGTTIGKLSEGWTDFALKGGNLYSRMELDARVPGKTASHLASSIDILPIGTLLGMDVYRIDQ